MTGTVTVYFNTGFNGIDIPSTPSVLAAATKKTYADLFFFREDIDKPVIRILDSYENLVAVDYCAITNTMTNKTCYYYASPRAVSKGVTALGLDLDALLTMGGAENLTYISGWQERGHIKKTDDVLFGNIAAEDWVPTQPLENKNMTKVEANGNYAAADLKLIVTNVDLSDLGQYPDIQEVMQGKVNTSGPDTEMYWPKLKSPTSATAFSVWDFDLSMPNWKSFKLPQTMVYTQVNPTDGTNVTTVQNGIENLFSAGQLQLQSSYILPKEYIQSYTYDSAHGSFSAISGIHGTLALSSSPFEYTVPSYTVKNKKVFSTFRQYGLVAMASGDICMKNAEDLYQSGLLNPSIDLWADVCATGKPYARFSYIKGAPIHYIDCVRGTQWANNQLVLEGASGSYWNAMNTAFSNQRLQREMSQNMFNQSVAAQGFEARLAQIQLGQEEAGVKMIAGSLGKHTGADSDVMSGISSVKTFGVGTNVGAGAITGRALQMGVDTLRSAVKAEYATRGLDIERWQLQNEINALSARTAMQNQDIQNEINQNSIGLIKNNNIVAPTVMFTPEQNLGLYGYNYFMAFEVRKTDEDLKSEDMYYQRYGYNGLHRPLTAQCFKERQYYNYVQAFDVNLKGATDFGLRVRTKAIAQLNKGVRVWRVLPDASYYDTN